MEVTREKDIVRIKGKMTEIRRAAKADGNRRIYHNYYNNCDKDEEIFVVYGKNTVVLWDDDDGVTRGYFYSSNEGELITLLGTLPEGCVIDIITRNNNEYADIIKKAGMVLHREMHRYVFCPSEEEKKKMLEREAILRAELYRPENVRSATSEDLELVINKLHEVFDADVSHLPDRNELLDLIEKKWVSLYFENQELKALHIFKIEASGRNYGYQIWNGTGVEGYYTVIQYSYGIYLKWLNEHVTNRDRIPLAYAWADSSNRKAIRSMKFSYGKFDGLIDFVYKKL